MLHSAMLCYVILFYAMQCGVVHDDTTVTVIVTVIVIVIEDVTHTGPYPIQYDSLSLCSTLLSSPLFSLTSRSITAHWTTPTSHRLPPSPLPLLSSLYSPSLYYPPSLSLLSFPLSSLSLYLSLLLFPPPLQGHKGRQCVGGYWHCQAS
jgi:hypothetical protein